MVVLSCHKGWMSELGYFCVCVGERAELELRVSEAFLFVLFYCEHLCGALLAGCIKGINSFTPLHV